MTTESNSNGKEARKSRRNYRGSSSDAVYGFGLIGAWIYYFTHATTLWLGVLGFFKGVFWPAMLVFELMKYLNM